MMKNLRSLAYSLLRQTERYTKTDMVYLTKGSILLTVGQVATSIFSFVLAIAFANFLSKESFGVYKYILSIGGIVSAFSLTGLKTSVINAVATGQNGVLKPSFFINLKWSYGVWLVSLAGAIYYFINNNYQLAIAFIVIGIATPLINGGNLYGAYLNGKKDFRTATLYNILSNLLPSALLLVSVYFIEDPLLLVAIFFLGNAVASLFFFSRVSKREPPVSTDINEIAKYGAHLSLMNLLSTLAGQLDKVLVFHYLGAAQLAIYTFATAVPKQLRGLISVASPLAAPKLANRSIDELKKSIPQKFLASLLIVGPIVVAYIIAAPYLFKLFFPQYLNSVPYSQAFALFLLILGNMSDAALTAKGAVTEKYVLNIGSGLLNILLMFIGIKWYGLWGLIIAVVVGKYLVSAASFVLLKRAKE